MRGGTNSRGYTIVEVMIFLAISGFMFIIAATFVSGKQSRSEFRQGLNDLNSQVQQAISDVSNGFYPSNGDFSCQASTSGVPVFTIAPNETGTNQGCVFLGKVIQFNTGSSSYKVLSVAGRQFAPNSNDVAASFSDAMPRVVRPPTSPVDLTQTTPLNWGLSVSKIINEGSVVSTLAIGFFGGYSNYNSGGLQSGAQSVVTIPITTSAINAGIKDAGIVANPNILICLDGGNGQFGSLHIGGAAADSGAGQRLTTSTAIGNSAAEVGC